MMFCGKKQTDICISMLRSLWATHRTVILLAAVVLMALVALPWIAMNFEKLLWEKKPWGAVDLKPRYEEVQLWFAGKALYSVRECAVYPPASYVMLWPLLGWLTFTQAKVAWAATMALALGWLAYLFVKEADADTHLERIFVVLMLLSMYATGFSIGHGQVTIHALTVLVAGLIRVARGPRTWSNDLAVTALILASLVKPSVTAPFFWLVIFIPGRLRPALLVVSSYIALTLLAIPFQGFDLLSLHEGWVNCGLKGVAHGTATGGYGNLHSWLAFLELKQWNVSVSLLMLLILGGWIYLHRHGDFWLMLGVTAIVSRFWVYHRAYDDMLVLLPLMTLFRMAKQGNSSNGGDEVAGILLAVTLIVMLTPGLKLVFPSWEPLLKAIQTLVHLVILFFLVYRARSAPTSRTGEHSVSH